MSAEVPIYLNWRASHVVLDQFTLELVDREWASGVDIEPKGYWFRGDFFHTLHNNFYDVPREENLVLIPLSVPKPETKVTRISVQRFFGQIGDGLRGHAVRYPFLREFVESLEALGEHFQGRLIDVTLQDEDDFSVITRMQSGELIVDTAIR